MSGDTQEAVTTAVWREFAGQERRFELNLGAIKRVEQRVGAGIGEVYRRVCTMTFTVDDVRQTIKAGLIGGSEGHLTDPEGEVLIRAFVDGRPLVESHELAKDILLACFVGMDKVGNPVGVKRAPGAPATSRPSTAPGAPPEPIPARSTQ